MLDLELIRSKPDLIRKAISDKRAGDPASVESLLKADEAHRSGITELQQLQATANKLARQIGELMRSGDRESAAPIIAENAKLKEKVKLLEQTVRDKETQVHDLLLEIPNIPHSSVPVGASPDDNVVAFEHGSRPSFGFDPKPHWDLVADSSRERSLVDFERGAKVTGAGFPVYRGPLARLQRALIAFFFEHATNRGYEELQVPLVVNEDSARGTGQLPDKEDQMYTAPRDGLFLIPTAELPVTNFHRDEILDADSLPLKYVAYTPCFRREAGSYGKEVRGLNRIHQFDKVELVHFVRPEDSYAALEELRQDAEDLLVQLELPYRRLLMCTADMGFTQAKKYDLEIYSAGQDRWLEVSSISNFEAFQSRRMKIRMRKANASPELLHTLNGSALALPRVVAGLVENGQQADGTVLLPAALHPFFGDKEFRTS